MENNNILSKTNILNFFKFLKITVDKDNSNFNIKDVLQYYDLKNKLLNINSKELNSLIQKYSKKTLVKNLALLFRNKKIEYPYVYLSITFDIIKHTVNELKNLSVNTKKINNNFEFSLNINLKNIIPAEFNYDFYKTNLNYFILNYFAEKDILMCKKKQNFISPLELIYSDNNYLETLFDSIINNYNQVTSQNIKIYLKKNIAFCSSNNLIHIISIIKHLFVDKSINNIINIGVDWGEFIILSSLFSNTKFYSYYLNDLHNNTINNIKNVFNTENIIYKQINLNDDINEFSYNYDILFINIDFLLNLFSTKDVNEIIIFENKIIPIMNKINSSYIVIKNSFYYDFKKFIDLVDKNIKFLYLIQIEEQAKYAIFSKKNMF